MPTWLSASWDRHLSALFEKWMPADEILDVIESVAFLKVAPATVRTALAAQRLPGRRVGKEWRLSRTALIAWLSEPGEATLGPRKRGGSDALEGGAGVWRPFGGQVRVKP